MSEWISVDDKLPDPGCLVLIFELRGRVQVAKRIVVGMARSYRFYVQINQHGIPDEYPTSDVTHWMKLSEPPK